MIFPIDSLYLHVAKYARYQPHILYSIIETLNYHF